MRSGRHSPRPHGCTVATTIAGIPHRLQQAWTKGVAAIYLDSVLLRPPSTIRRGHRRHTATNEIARRSSCRWPGVGESDCTIGYLPLQTALVKQFARDNTTEKPATLGRLRKGLIMHPDIRLAQKADIEQMHAIYAPIVRDTVISFELTVPTVDDFQGRVTEGRACFPWLVCDRAGEVLGYAYAARHRARPAYQWSVESSVYVKDGARGLGVGRGLYAALLEILRRLGYYNVYAGIALPNPASIALHRACGFHEIGVFEAAGFKLGGWHDVAWWQFRLAELPVNPLPPVALAEYSVDQALDDTLMAAIRFTRL